MKQKTLLDEENRLELLSQLGDPLEIFTDREGQVILKKYSPIGELSEFANGYAETLSKTTGHIACITDKDTVIAVSGTSKKEWLEQGISQELERILDDKHIKLELTDDAKNYLIENGYDEIYGARPLKRFVQKKLETLIAKKILEQEILPNTTIKIGLSENELQLIK